MSARNTTSLIWPSFQYSFTLIITRLDKGHYFKLKAERERLKGELGKGPSNEESMGAVSGEGAGP